MKKFMNDYFPRGKVLKCIIMMKMVWIFVLASALQVTAGNMKSYSQATKLNLRLKNVSLESVIWNIKKQTEFSFFYNSEDVKGVKNIDVDLQDVTVEEILLSVLDGTNLTFDIVHKAIIIKKDFRLKSRPIAISEQQPQQKEITGKVTDASGEPLPGVTIIVKGTTQGTVTNVDGEFSFRIPLEAKILQFSFVGMEMQEVPIGERTTFSIVLEEATIGLEEVIAVGYGIQKKESVVGSISQVDNEDLRASGNVPDIRQALTGQIPGITTITSSGEPGGVRSGGSGTEIFIRGKTSWNASQPLILVDGVERSMENLDASEVESISVLKDASATAVFGVKGANGVIMITTKRGTTKKPTFSASYTTTGKMLSKVPERMESFNAIMIRNEAIERETPLREESWGEYIPYEIAFLHKRPQLPEHVAIFPNVDWQKAVWKDLGFSHRANLNIQGGTRLVRYFASFSFLNEGDMFRDDYDNNKGYEPSFDYNRFNFRSNLDFKLTKTTTLTTNISGNYNQKNNTWIGSGTGNWDHLLWNSVYLMAPDLYIPQHPDGRWGYSSIVTRHNPIASVYNTGILNTRTTQLNLDVKLEQELDFITEGLTAKASIFYDNSISSEGGLYDVAANAVPQSQFNTPGKVIHWDRYEGPEQDPSEYTEDIPQEFPSNQFDWIVRPWYLRSEQVGPTFWANWIPITRRSMYEFQLNYGRRFGVHNVGAMGVFKREEYARGTMFPKFREDWVFRATYDYDSKYLFEVNGAYNGSEQFGPDYRFDFFPSMAVGWFVSRENFFKVDWVDHLKLRFSTGLVGDDNLGSARWLYNDQYSVGGRSRFGWPTWSYSPYTRSRESVVGNPEIRWEKALKNNFGMDLGLFKNMLSVVFDYYTEDRSDIFIPGSARSVPPFFGIAPPPANLGQVKSQGYEFELNYRKRVNNDFSYWGKFSFAHNTNEVIFRDDPLLEADHLKNEGFPIGQIRSLKATEFYNNWDEVYASVPMEINDLQKLPGFYNLLDFDGDGVIKSANDAVPIGYTEEPQNTYNYTLGASYKGFSAMVQFYAVNNASRSVPLSNFNSGTNVVFDHVKDYWSKDNQDATSFLPRWKTSGQNIGDYYIYDASYIRLQTAEIAYSLNKQLIKTLGLSDFQVFLNGTNLFFWSKLPDDRESARAGASAANGAYPTVKRINLGIKVNF
jgi:TonB-linked SusC/RagA family outer membrane protein